PTSPKRSSRSPASSRRGLILEPAAPSSPPDRTLRARPWRRPSAQRAGTTHSSDDGGRPPMPEPFDLVILGSGSTAIAADIRATDLGARVAMVERRTLGGTCANRGCLPSKNLIEAARIVHEAAHPRYPGLSPAD